MPLATGHRLGPYEIVARLGAGGMGEVYRARDTRLDRDVALKVLPSDVAAHPDRLARLEREAKTVAGLNHPNIVVLHSIEDSAGVRFLTMELVDGDPLDRLVVPGGLAPSRVLQIALPIIEALAAAHARGIVHRDLKPANVIVARDGRVKVLDFGLAKLAAVGSPDLMPTRTASEPISSIGQVVGTMPYMAPEQLRGEPADARSDLFSFGVLIYELTSGRRPFAGETSADVTSSILRDTPPPLASLRTDVPPELARVIERCLEKDPARRAQTARDVRAELEGARLAVSQSAGARAARAPGPAAPADTPSIAILPFLNMSRDEENEYFSDGLAEELLNVLAKIRGLRVAARSSAFSFKGKNATVAEVGKSLQVGSVLEGSVRKAGNRVRIAVQLVKVDGGFPLWSESYDRTLEDIFAVQDDIAHAVVKELRTTLLGEQADSDASGEAKADVAQAAIGRGENAEAHRLFLHGRFMLDRFTREDIARAIEYLRQAVELDPRHALAWALLSRAHSTAANYGWMAPEEGYERGREYASRALEVDPNLAEAHIALAQVQQSGDWDWKGTYASTRRAVELAPGDADVLRHAAALGRSVGSLDESIAWGELAVELDPLNAGALNVLASCYRSARRYADAERGFRRALELSPGRAVVHWMLSSTLVAQGRLEEALAETRLEPEMGARLTGEAVALFSLGRKDESDRALRELTEEHAINSGVRIAGVYAIFGDFDGAFAWLERARTDRDAGLAFVHRDPGFVSLHSDSRWKPFLRSLGFEA